MPFARVSAIGRSLVMAVGLALSALGTPAHASDGCGAEFEERPRQEQTTIESQDASSGYDLRAGEHTRLVSSGAPCVLRAPTAGSTLAAATYALCEPLGADGRRGCGVVQCRRLDGVQLLGFATPPPTNG